LKSMNVGRFRMPNLVGISRLSTTFMWRTLSCPDIFGQVLRS
jgi:hypothetical protein